MGQRVVTKVEEDATEYTVKNLIVNFKTNQQEALHTRNEKPISNDPEKDTALNKLTSLDKSKSSSRTETEDTVIPETKTRSISLASSDDKNIK